MERSVIVNNLISLISRNKKAKNSKHLLSIFYLELRFLKLFTSQTIDNEACILPLSLRT